MVKDDKKKGSKGKKRSENAVGSDKGKHDKDSNQKDDSDEIDLSTIEIDPDEPTYCLCDQVSYGEMIGCDNDLCPIEWFHFNCVQLSTKPKGKWYCPKCRGDKPTLMKPKAQFLKELEKFNKEREEKLMKQNG
jgi:inhibitor-of-growth protein 1